MAGVKNRPAASSAGTLKPSSLARAAKTSSQRAKIRRVASLSWTVCCRLTMTDPSCPASPLAARCAGDVTTRSAFMPQSDVPKANTRSASRSQARRSPKRSSRNEPPIGTTWLCGACHAPWISLIASCGKPAFCGSPSWFWLIHRCIKPASWRPTRTLWDSVGWAQKGERKEAGPSPEAAPPRPTISPSNAERAGGAALLRLP
mmetsp:Transcript_17452/g.38218  ORF Transcript_17452/g.38218 Transcript_17452/m.38218 type:complete len:203 (-) Transcript_17452:288-896(-)